MKKYILWDMDGTLIDSEAQYYRAWCRTLRRLLGVEEVDWEGWKTVVGVRNDAFVAYMKERYGVDPEDPEIRREYGKDRDAVLREEGFAPMPGVKETLSLLREKGYVQAVASSSAPSAIIYRMEGIGCREYFDLLFSGEAVKNGKPAPDTFLECAKTLGADASLCVVVEDSENGTRAARAAGMFCIGLKNPGSGDQNLSCADVQIRDLREVPGILEKL